MLNLAGAKRVAFRTLATMVTLCLLCAATKGADSIRITKVEPTIFFPQVRENEPLRQIAELSLNNPGVPVMAQLKISIRDEPSYIEELGVVEAGATVRQIHVLDIAQPTEVTFELYRKDAAKPDSTLTIPWRPQKKWILYDVAFSHHDLGFADYYHMMRRDVREWGIELALQYCTETDDWDEDSKFRWTIETAEPVIGYIQIHGESEVNELIRRINEGRIELGAIHNSATTDAMSYESLARLFYTPNRHVVDLLGIAPRKTALLDDVVGLTRPLPLYTKEAGIPYFYHGRNSIQDEHRPASSRPVYFWQAPDGDKQNMTLFRTETYYSPFRIGDCSEERIKSIVTAFQNRNDWPYDCILCTESFDFSLPKLDHALKARNWNTKWSYPRIRCATITMFFEDIASQANPADVYVFDKDAPNAWVDQDSTDAALAGRARKLGYAIPTAEKLATVTTVLGGAGYPWQDIWEAYNRVLMYHEHTNGAYAEGPIYAPNGLKDKTGANATYYEVEKEMHRALVSEGEALAESALQSALSKLENMITTDPNRTLIVFNPLTWERTDLVRLKDDNLPYPFHVVDNVTGRSIPCQKMSDGTTVFVARNIPSLGYKTFRIVPGEKPSGRNHSSLRAASTTLENKFYKIVFDPETAGIVSIHDKQMDVELVDRNAPHKFNEYLYQRYETNSYLKPQWYRAKTENLSSVAGEVAGMMTADVAAVGAETIKQTVVIYNDIKRIDFLQHIDKAPSGRKLNDYKSFSAKGKEAVFYALPFAIEGFQVKHELSGAVVEPIAEQSPGSATDYYAIQHFSDISNAQYGVTLAPVEPALVEYGRPRPATFGPSHSGESILRKPDKSYMYLYLMNNMFFTNVCIDQPGPKIFSWSIRSHKGDWRQGKAFTFGWDISHPLIARVARKTRSGILPPDQHSFLKVDKPNVICSTIKPAEANGDGIILRFFEVAGRETTARIEPAFLDQITTANETTLIEDDRQVPVKTLGDNEIELSFRPHGIKTVRIRSAPTTTSLMVTDVRVKAVSDMRTKLSWSLSDGTPEKISHYNIYRGVSPDFKPSLRRLVGRSTGTSYIDGPKLNYGGWMNNLVEPETTYYYRITAVDRWNNEGQACETVGVTTMKASERNVPPARVEGPYVVHVSPVTKHNFLCLWFYTNCESDVVRYRIDRSTTPGFSPDKSTRLTEIDATAMIQHVTPHRFGTVERAAREYNRQMYVDETVTTNVTYYYRICAIDSAGNAGPYSYEVSGRVNRNELFIRPGEGERQFTKSITVTIDSSSEKGNIIRYTLDGSRPTRYSILYTAPFELTETTTVRAALFASNQERTLWMAESTFLKGAVAKAQSGWSPAQFAIDGNHRWAWVSAPWGGGTKQQPNDVWLAVEFPNRIKVQGLVIVWDSRPGIPRPEHYLVQYSAGKGWQLATEIQGSSEPTKRIVWDEPIETDAVRLYFPGDDLPNSDNAKLNGMVRVSELLFVLPDGTEIVAGELAGPSHRNHLFN